MKIYIDTVVCKGCGLCIYYCPRTVLRLSDKRNPKGYAVAEVYDLEDCVGCKLCEINCPDLAIYVEDEEQHPIVFQPRGFSNGHKQISISR